jgi:Capsular polysaccharide biosynthesis protein
MADGGEMRVPPWRKIYLARSGRKWRRVTNEPEIIDLLERHGFEQVFAEELSLSEQISLFAEASMIVAPNGSALLNIVYSSPDVKVFVLSQDHLHNWAGFYGPFRALGYRDVTFICGEAIGTSEKHVDYRIPLSLVREAVIDGRENSVS